MMSWTTRSWYLKTLSLLLMANFFDSLKLFSSEEEKKYYMSFHHTKHMHAKKPQINSFWDRTGNLVSYRWRCGHLELTWTPTLHTQKHALCISRRVHNANTDSHTRSYFFNMISWKPSYPVLNYPFPPATIHHLQVNTHHTYHQNKHMWRHNKCTKRKDHAYPMSQCWD